MIFMTASELAEAIRTRQLSSREVVETHINRIEHVDKRIDAVVLRRFEEALLEADDADDSRLW